MMTTTRYTFAQRSLHWLIALIVFGLLAIGLTFMALGYDGTKELFGNDTTNALYTYHKSFGLLLLLLMVLRLALRLASPPPAYDPPLTGAERLVGGATHLLFYLLLIGMPIGGALATMLGGYPVQFFAWELPAFLAKNEALSQQLFAAHGIAGLIVLALLVLHIGAAIKHWKLGDGIMHRISLP
jgi:cytochrome b561